MSHPIFNLIADAAVILLQVGVLYFTYSAHNLQRQWMDLTNRRLDYLERALKELRDYRGF